MGIAVRGASASVVRVQPLGDTHALVLMSR